MDIDSPAARGPWLVEKLAWAGKLLGGVGPEAGDPDCNGQDFTGASMTIMLVRLGVGVGDDYGDGGDGNDGDGGDVNDGDGDDGACCGCLGG